MLEDLRKAPENSVIILQLAAHNPTGCDLTQEQLTLVADVMEVCLSHVMNIFKNSVIIPLVPNLVLFPDK
jgi:aspartate/tyrosine/aromatic aminotransferase